MVLNLRVQANKTVVSTGGGVTAEMTVESLEFRAVVTDGGTDSRSNGETFMTMHDV